jgi:hypothetical protein
LQNTLKTLETHMNKMILGIVMAGTAMLGMVSGPATAAPAASNDFGIGFVLGNPSGLSAKIPAGSINAFHLILAYNQNRGWGNRGWDDDNCGPGPGNDNCDGRLYLGGDYVWYNYNAIHVSKGRLPFYYGPGIWTSVANDAGVGIRFALGLEYQFANAPFDIFLEIAPGIRVIPNTNGYVSSGLGGRFYF